MEEKIYQGVRLHSGRKNCNAPWAARNPSPWLTALLWQEKPWGPCRSGCIEASANIIKNVKAWWCPIPAASGALRPAAAAGIIADRRAGLQVLSQVTEDQVRAIDDFLEKGEFHVERSGKDYVFHIRVVLFAGADTASAEIAGFHQRHSGGAERGHRPPPG